VSPSAAATCLVVKIGNSSAAAGLYRGGRVTRVRRLPTTRQTPAGIRRLLREVLGGRRVRSAGLCCVVPRLRARWVRALRAATGAAPLEVHCRLRLGATLRYPRPATLGADRLANAAALAAEGRGPAIVMDFGTASVFDAFDRRGCFMGGVIAPGYGLVTEYLHRRTALLPRIRAAGRVPPIGRSTREAMRVGARVGYRGLVRDILAHVELGLGGRSVRVLATGGHARAALRDLRVACRVDPHLTLRGVGRIVELNG
jgi:type III pantothenate kinase